MDLMRPGRAADVSTPSGERSAMDRDLDMISHIREGASAIRRHSSLYLPKYENESREEYRRRVQVAPWRPEFTDTLRFLASKPFGADVKVADDTPERLAELANDIDGSGENLTRFARHALTEAIANGVHGILVDYTKTSQSRALSVAEEREIGARPVWRHVPVTAIVALRTSTVNGREVVTHLRYRYEVVEPDGFGEKRTQQIRVIEPDHWEVWQLNDHGVWIEIDQGPILVAGKTPDEVPLALLFTGERLGQLQTRPPLRDLAEVQIELFRALSRQEEILTYTGSPMLAAVGMTQPTSGNIEIGPKTILFAPAVGDGVTARWEFISPDAHALAEIRLHITSIIEDMHRLGLQPTTTRSGAQTATMASITASKAHSVLGAWAIGLKDFLEHAYQFTARWMAIDHDTVVQVFTDFAVGGENVDECELILQAEGASVISKLTARDELHRRNILGPQYDARQETRRLARQVKSVTVPGTMPLAIVADPDVPAVPGTGVDEPPEPLLKKPTAKRRRRAMV